jgi:hypothetical protein
MHLQAIGQVASYDQRNLLLPQFLNGDLQRVGLSLDVNENGRVHAEGPVRNALKQHTNRKSDSRPSNPTYLICNARVPSTRALSYLVMYGVVLRFSFEIFLSLTPFTVLSDFAAFSCAEMSPLVTMLPMSSPSSSPLAPFSLPGSSKSCSTRSFSSMRLSSFSLRPC